MKSARRYRIALRAYPRVLRDRWGDEMLDTLAQRDHERGRASTLQALGLLLTGLKARVSTPPAWQLEKPLLVVATLVGLAGSLTSASWFDVSLMGCAVALAIAIMAARGRRWPGWIVLILAVALHSWTPLEVTLHADSYGATPVLIRDLWLANVALALAAIALIVWTAGLSLVRQAMAISSLLGLAFALDTVSRAGVPDSVRWPYGSPTHLALFATAILISLAATVLAVRARRAAQSTA